MEAEYRGLDNPGLGSERDSSELSELSELRLRSSEGRLVVRPVLKLPSALGEPTNKRTPRLRSSALLE